MFTSGFAEIDAGGAEVQARMAAAAKAAGVRLLGPNCLGFMNIAERVFATFAPVVNAGVPPLGRIGRFCVRLITASISASYHMLSAPEAPAPMAMHRIATTPSTGCTEPGASIRPTKAVKMTRDITRGFRSAT